MERRKADPERPDPALLAYAAGVLARGGLVAFPTETVYGICADATSPDAVRRLYAAKGRGAEKACAYLLPDRAAADTLAGSLPPLARRLADRLWPGPVTLVVPGPDGREVGLRLPAPALPRALARAAGRPLLQTSANRSGEPAALNASAVAAALGDALALLLDGGRAPGGKSSTVVRCGRALTVLRAGAVSDRDLLRAATELTLSVCTGNLCRSPLAEALFRKALAEVLGCAAGDVLRFGHRFGSTGTMALAGRPATPEAILVGDEHGVDLRPHRSRPFSIGAVKNARRVFCLAQGHRDFLRPYFAERPEDLALLDPKGRDIPDPYGQPLRTYRRAAAQIEEAVRVRTGELADEGSPPPPIS